MPNQFVILRHDHPFLHWDLLLEEATFARCWRLLREPCTGEPIAAEPLPPHRLFYLNYEGPVEGSRGTVQQIVSGTFAIVDPSSDALQLEFFDNSVFAGGRLISMNDGRQFWMFESSMKVMQNVFS